MRDVIYVVDVLTLREDGLAVVVAVMGALELIAGPLTKLVGTNRGARGNGEGQEHARDGGMDATHVHAEPQQQPQHNIPADAIDVEPVHEQENAEHHGHHDEPVDVR